MTLRRHPAWATTQPAGGLVADAYVRFSREGLGDLLRSTEFTIVVKNLFDKASLSAHHRDHGLARRAADDLNDRDRLVLTAATA